jgi:long-subunit acyl-CoA synthetase (AMP-forming)
LAVEAVYGQIALIDQIAVFGDGQKYLVGLVTLKRPQIDQFLAASGASGPATGPQSSKLIKEVAAARNAAGGAATVRA